MGIKAAVSQAQQKAAEYGHLFAEGKSKPKFENHSFKQLTQLQTNVQAYELFFGRLTWKWRMEESYQTLNFTGKELGTFGWQKE